ncbi:cell division protein FtsZ [Colwellia sp. E2M01]|uniref:cell division protein FtsZ n=1 Tax=Colwellia sp. E2M01 TaxID=2841561 RepID=UPI001C095D63|nr:cell division protein FtsZ [Colwellia sp. E2M01]MBU2870547.1 cell division FtsZ family protein [Colwellia sp. E2M01]
MKELLHGNPELLITVIGIGGCGCNTVNMLHENNLSGQVNLIAVNTDLAALNSINVEKKILIGENLTNGYGAGADPDIGFQAAQESEELLRNAIVDSDIVIITAGFGGGTGTGASPLVAKICRELKINCLAIVTLPFESEGQKRLDYALQGIDDIKEPIHAFITLSNDLLLKGLGESVGLFSAFNQSNEVLKNLLIALVQMLNETGYVNVDKNDFSTILSYEGESILGVGKANSEEEAFDALDQALNNPLVSIANIDTAKGIIFQLFCKSEPKLSTYNGLIDHIRTKITNQSVLIVPGVTLDPNLSSEIEILIIGSGISSDTTVKPTIKIAEQTPLMSTTEADTTVPDIKKTSVDYSTAPEYLDDELSFVNQGESLTDIPAITRKLMAINRL